MSVNSALSDYLKGIRISDEEVAKRRDICDSCEMKDKLVVEYCGVCKCLISAKTKAANEKCPLGFW